MKQVIVDSGLLLLLAVGLTDSKLIAKHKRTRSFEIEDFELLVSVLGRFDKVVVTPHIVTEVSNLASQTDQTTAMRIRATLAALLEVQEERYGASQLTVQHKHFLRLGITDCAILDLTSSEMPLITVDLELYLAAAKEGAVNFHYLRQERLLQQLR